MLTADERAALVERLRDDALARERGWRDLEAAADELSRPRPRVEFTAPVGGYVEAHVPGLGMVWSGTIAVALAKVEGWRANGFDVAEVPRVHGS